MSERRAEAQGGVTPSLPDAKPAAHVQGASGSRDGGATGVQGSGKGWAGVGAAPGLSVQPGRGRERRCWKWLRTRASGFRSSERSRETQRRVLHPVTYHESRRTKVRRVSRALRTGDPPSEQWGMATGCPQGTRGRECQATGRRPHTRPSSPVGRSGDRGHSEGSPGVRPGVWLATRMAKSGAGDSYRPPVCDQSSWEVRTEPINWTRGLEPAESSRSLVVGLTPENLPN